MKRLLSVFALLLVVGCNSNEYQSNIVYETPDLKIDKISDHVYRHISYLKTEDRGKVASNGMVVVNGGESIVFDTPTNDTASLQLINWLRDSLGVYINTVISTDFHRDAMEGIDVFQKQDIHSYANMFSISHAMGEGVEDIDLPEKVFEDILLLKIGDNQHIIARFVGAGHTKGNIIGYYPAENVLFGGGLVRALDDGKGDLNSADVKAWPKTVQKIKMFYPEIKIVIPKYGNPGGPELLDYTIGLFKKN